MKCIVVLHKETTRIMGSLLTLTNLFLQIDLTSKLIFKLGFSVYCIFSFLRISCPQILKRRLLEFQMSILGNLTSNIYLNFRVNLIQLVSLVLVMI